MIDRYRITAMISSVILSPDDLGETRDCIAKRDRDLARRDTSLTNSSRTFNANKRTGMIPFDSARTRHGIRSRARGPFASAIDITAGELADIQILAATASGG